MELVRPLVLKERVPPRFAVPLTTRRLAELLLIKTLNMLPAFRVSPPTVSVPELDPLPGAMIPPLFTVTAPVILPVPLKVPVFVTLMAPAPLLVPLS